MGTNEVTCSKCGAAYEYDTPHDKALCEMRSERDSLEELCEDLTERLAKLERRAAV